MYDAEFSPACFPCPLILVVCAQDAVELMKEIATDRVLEEAGGFQDFRTSGGARGNKAVRPSRCHFL